MTTDHTDQQQNGKRGSRTSGTSGTANGTSASPQFVESFAAQLTEAGMQRMPARVFGALLVLRPGALTSAELSEQLQVSPAAVSGAVRYLAQVHMVTREREPGSRRDRYRVHASTWYEALTNRDQILKRWEVTLKEGVASLGPDTAAGRRMSETLEFFAFLETELRGLMDRWRVRREELFGDQAGSA